MKNLLLIFALVLGASAVQAQTFLLQEDFEGGVIPGTWTLINVDGRTPDPAVNYVNAAWIARQDFVDPTDTVAVSTSWYSPVGQADDWLITPQITLGTGNILRWMAKAQDASFPDGYEVKVSTTGTATTDFTTTVFSTNAEVSTWTQRSVDLGSFGLDGQSVYIAFRNNSNDMFLLLIDDVEVADPFNDVGLVNGSPNEYTQVPANHIAPIDLTIDLENNGIASTNGVVYVDVTKDGSPVLSDTSATIASLAISSSQNVMVSAGFTPSGPGSYVFTYRAEIAEMDVDSTNDMLVTTLEITDTTYARDNGIFGGAVGFNGNTGSLGTNFQIVNSDTLSSISFMVNGDKTGDTYSFSVFPATNDTTTGSAIWTSNVMTFDGSEDSVWTTVPAIGIAPVVLNPGLYLVVMDQLSTNNLQLVTDSDGGDIIGTPQWSIYTTFGHPLLRINLGNPPPPDTTSGVVEVLDDALQLFPNPTTDHFTVELNGKYVIKVVNALGEEMLLQEQTGTTTFSTKEWSAGAYFVTISRNEESAMRKLVITR